MKTIKKDEEYKETTSKVLKKQPSTEKAVILKIEELIDVNSTCVSLHELNQKYSNNEIFQIVIDFFFSASEKYPNPEEIEKEIISVFETKLFCSLAILHQLPPDVKEVKDYRKSLFSLSRMINGAYYDYYDSFDHLEALYEKLELLFKTWTKEYWLKTETQTDIRNLITSKDSIDIITIWKLISYWPEEYWEDENLREFVLHNAFEEDSHNDDSRVYWHFNNPEDKIHLLFESYPEKLLLKRKQDHFYLLNQIHHPDGLLRQTVFQRMRLFYDELRRDKDTKEAFISCLSNPDPYIQTEAFSYLTWDLKVEFDQEIKTILSDVSKEWVQSNAERLIKTIIANINFFEKDLQNDLFEIAPELKEKIGFCPVCKSYLSLLSDDETVRCPGCEKSIKVGSITRAHS
ncbi:hypothetical protein CEE45_08615 [Candidatus Heimdallarchaeota archaeon B3_Heim]|nr:MAG: hypothetical protein CEE45_08615 [Candidatus Heimdallarchaeota archaeon B3_Heim]